MTGTYQWDASYWGDTNNNKASDNNDPNEVAQVVAPDATPNTTPGGTVTAGAGVAMTDSATLSGYYPAGTITFQLYAPGVTAANYTTATPVYTDVVTLTGSAAPVTVSTAMGNNPGGYTPAAGARQAPTTGWPPT